MKALLIAIFLSTAAILVVPAASAEPCEVPGCNVVGATVCLANEVTEPGWNYKQAVATVDTCTTQTA